MTKGRIIHIGAGSALRPYVRYYWAYRNADPLKVMTFPIGSTQMIFHRGRPLYVPEIDSWHSAVTLSGQVNFHSHLQSFGNLDMIAVFFTPQGMRAFFDMPVSELYNREIPASDIGDSSLTELGRKVLECQDTGQCINMIDAWLKCRLADRYNVRRMSLPVYEMTVNPSASVNSLADLASLGRKQFVRIFKDVIGLNPKEYQRILRFQKVLYMMQMGCRDEMRMVAECGYSDQSHLVREFRRFSGVTPLGLFGLMTPYSDFYSNPMI